MKPSLNTAGNVIIDEWGKCVVKEEDTMCLDADGVLDSIQQNNPAITAVHIFLYKEEDSLLESDYAHEYNVNIDWAIAGRSIGSNEHITFLKLEIGYLNQTDAEAFFGGLALNRSIQALKIVDNISFDDPDKDGSIVRFTLFKALVPFFQRNTNIQVFDLTYDERPCPVGCIKDILTAAKSLKSIEISLVSYVDWKETIQTIVEKGLVHLSLNGGCYSRTACGHLKSLLSDEQCVLRSLTLENRYNTDPCVYNTGPCVLSWDRIFSGLSNNKSVECLKLNFGEKDTSHIIDLLQHHQLSSVEKFKLVGNDTIIFPPLHTIGHQLPNIKSLSLENIEIGAVAREIGHRVEPSFTSALRELIISFGEAEDLHELSSYISGNSSIRVLDLADCGQEVSSASWVAFFDSVRSSKYLESIKINYVITSDAVMESFSSWITLMQSLKALTVEYCNNVTFVGRQSLANALASLDISEDIDIRIYQGDDDEDLPEMDLDPILNTFITKPTLKRVSIDLTMFAQLQVIANVLESPNCSITEMEIGYHDRRNPNTGQFERERLTQTLVNSLQRNSSLRTLNFHIWNGLFRFDWPSVSNLLCDTSNIDATIQSNHTLESIISSNPSHIRPVPIDVCIILHMNRNTNKHAVIREKVLRNHGLDQVNFVPTSLPDVFSWLGSAEVDQTLGLSQLYRILRTVPHMIRKNVDETRGVKRKELNND
jgi:hypothetical protein